MKNYSINLQSIIIAFVLICSMSSVNAQRERADDRIVNLSDTLVTSIPMLPMLCDSLDLHTQRVDIGGCELHVEKEGKGDPIVLINGGPGGTHHYFHPWFSRLKNDFTIIYYDQRGTGQSDFKPEAGYTFEQAVDDLEALREKLGYEKWYLIGYSYGGGLAQFYSLKYPTRVKGMVLVNALPLMPNVTFNGEQNKYISQAELDKRGEIIKAYSNGSLSINEALYNLSANGDWKRQHYLKPDKNDMIRAAHYEWVNDKKFNSIMSKSCGRYDFENAFDDCPIPTLVLEGKKDLTWGSAKHEIFRKNHPNAQFYLFENAGHPIYSEAPEEFFKMIREFAATCKEVPTEQLKAWKLDLSALIVPSDEN